MVGAAGGLHKFMGRDRPLITDSGGFQIFSFAHRGERALPGRTADAASGHAQPRADAGEPHAAGDGDTDDADDAAELRVSSGRVDFKAAEPETRRRKYLDGELSTTVRISEVRGRDPTDATAHCCSAAWLC